MVQGGGAKGHAGWPAPPSVVVAVARWPVLTSVCGQWWPCSLLLSLSLCVGGAGPWRGLWWPRGCCWVRVGPCRAGAASPSCTGCRGPPWPPGDWPRPAGAQGPPRAPRHVAAHLEKTCVAVADAWPRRGEHRGPQPAGDTQPSVLWHGLLWLAGEAGTLGATRGTASVLTPSLKQSG